MCSNVQLALRGCPHITSTARGGKGGLQEIESNLTTLFDKVLRGKRNYIFESIFPSSCLGRCKLHNHRNTLITLDSVTFFLQVGHCSFCLRALARQRLQKRWPHWVPFTSFPSGRSCRGSMQTGHWSSCRDLVVALVLPSSSAPACLCSRAFKLEVKEEESQQSWFG